MNFTAMASGALEEMDGSNWREAFVRGELNDNHTSGNELQQQQQRQVTSDLFHAPPTPEISDESERMNAMASTSDEVAQPTALSEQDNEHAMRKASLADARAKKASKSKKRVMNYWTAEEEDALWSALEEVGPKWTLIVKRYGKDGEISEVLKARDTASLSAKASYTKKMLVEKGEEVPAYLEQIVARDHAGLKPSRRHAADAGSDGEYSGPAHRIKRRARHRPQQSSDAAVKHEEQPVTVIDDSDEEDTKDEFANLPSSTPKTKRQGQAAAAAKPSAAETDPTWLKLRIEAASRAKELADLQLLLHRGESRQLSPTLGWLRSLGRVEWREGYSLWMMGDCLFVRGQCFDRNERVAMVRGIVAFRAFSASDSWKAGGCRRTATRAQIRCCLNR